MDLLCYADTSEKICLCFFPCMNIGENITWEEWHTTEPLIVYATDYAMLIPYFNKAFPIADPINGKTQDSLDLCFDNWIGKSDWRDIVRYISNEIPVIENEKEAQFFKRFIDWIETRLSWADIIIVEGNL